MTPEELTGMLSEVRRLRQGFARITPQPWTATTAAAELTVQLGHLALCLLHRQGADTTDLTDPQRPISNIGDEVADIAAGHPERDHSGWRRTRSRTRPTPCAR